MTLSLSTLRPLALALLLPTAACLAQAPALPTLQQAQDAMDLAIAEQIAARPRSDSSSLVAMAFRPTLESLSSCAVGSTADTATCIVVGSAGMKSGARLLHLAWVDGQWTLPDPRRLPTPAPSREEVQPLLRAHLATVAARESDAEERARFMLAVRDAQVLEIADCEVPDERAVFECAVTAQVGDEQGTETLAFIREDGQWRSAPAPR